MRAANGSGFSTPDRSDHAPLTPRPSFTWVRCRIRTKLGVPIINRRGLIEDLAEALGCSVADLTGQPYLAVDRQSADTAATIPGVSAAMHDTTLDDIPDVPARPLPDLLLATSHANAYADDARYAMAGRGMGALLTELHVHAVTGDSRDRQMALVALAEACMVAYCLTLRIGHADLAVVAARRGFDAAVRAERPDLAGMLAMSRTVAVLVRVTALPPCAQVCSVRSQRCPAQHRMTPPRRGVRDPAPDVGSGRRPRRSRR